MRLSDQDLLALIPRYPEARSTSEIRDYLARTSHKVTARTVQRRLNGLPAGWVVTSSENIKPTMWSIAPTAPLTFGIPSLQEAIALKMAQRHLAEVLPVEIVRDLKPYFERADDKLKGAKLYRAWIDKVRMISPAQSLLKPKFDGTILAACYDAVLNEKQIHILYQRDDAKAKAYNVDALAVVLRGPVTYLVVRFAWSLDPALLVLHRIKSANLSDMPFHHSEPFDLDAFIEGGAFGFDPKGSQTLRVRFFDNAGAHLVDTPFSDQQDLKKVGTDQHILTVNIPITQQLKWWLLGFGERVRVDAPASLRRELRGRLEAAVARYKK